MAKIYHYTSIETLALILKSRKIRFNRLDRVDDLEEYEYGVSDADLKLGKYTFVSCWTRNRIENIALWGLYTQYKGIRIEMDEDMFITYGNDDFRSYFERIFTIGNDYLIHCSNAENKLIDIDYVEDLEFKNRTIGEYREQCENKSFSISFSNKYGTYKRKHWEFQNESRFKITAFPIPPILNDGDMSNEQFLNASSKIGNLLKNNIPISIEELDVSINNSAYINMDIMLGPQTTYADRIIVESLLKSHGIPATPKDSYFKNKIRLKGTY